MEALSNPSAKSLTVEKLFVFRDELIGVLDHQIKLLLEMDEMGLVPFHNASQDLVIDDKHLPEMVKLLEGEKHKLRNFDVILAVVGTMKAGKSTTINAIVGKEIMPNRNRPMTAVPTLICHKQGQLEPVVSFDPEPINAFLNQIAVYLKVYPEAQENVQAELQPLCNSIVKGGRFRGQSIGSEKIFNVLSSLNDLVRLADALGSEDLKFPFDSYRDIQHLPMIEVEFAYLKDKNPTTGRLMLLDTPGPNEARQSYLKVMLEQQLKRSSAVILVLDYTQLKSEAEEEVRTQLGKIPKIDNSRLYAFVNKFDQKSANADDARITKALVSADLLAGRINIDRVYPISAQDAYLSNRLADHYRKHGRRPLYTENSWVADFAKKAFGEIDSEEWEEYSDSAIVKRINRLLERSNIHEPMQHVVISAGENAPFLAICSALVDVDKVFSDIKNVFSINGYFSQQVELNEQDLKRIKRAIAQMEKDQVKVAELSKRLTQDFKESLVKLKQDLNETSKGIVFDVETQTQYAIAKLSREMETNLRAAQKKYEDAASLREVWRDFLHFDSFEDKKARREAIVQKRLEAAAHFAASEASLGNNQSSKILTLAETDKETFLNLMNDISRSLSVMANDYANNAVKNHLKVMHDGLETIRNEYKKSFDSIKRKFSEEGMDLSFELPEHFVMEARAVDHVEVEDTAINVDVRIHTIEQAGLLGWFKRIVAMPFSADWGTDSVEYQLYQIDLLQVAEQIAATIHKDVIHPIIRNAEFDVAVKANSIDDYALQIQDQVDRLLNELQLAIENEQLPYAEKAKRKEKLSRIARQNFQVEGRIQMIKGAFLG